MVRDTALVLGACLVALLYGAHVAGMLLVGIANWGIDFAAYWDGARALVATGSPYTALAASSAPMRGSWLGYIYPPVLALLLAPLTRLMDYSSARLVWLATSAMCLMLGVVLTWRDTELRWQGGHGLAGLLGLVLAPWAIIALGVGQPSPQLLLLVAAAYSALGDGRPVLGGALLAFAGHLRIFPGLVAGYPLLRQEWRAVVGAVASGLVIAAGSVAILGWEPHAAYLGLAVGGLSRLFALPNNVSVTGFFSRLFAGNPETVPIAALPSGVVSVAIVVVGASLLVVSGYAIWWARHDRERDALAYALAVVATLLVSPVSGSYNLVIAAFPLAVAVGRVQAAWPRHLPWLLSAMALLSLPSEPCDLLPIRLWCASYLTPGDVPIWLLPGRQAWGTLMLGPQFYGLLVLWALLLRLCLASVTSPMGDAPGRGERAGPTARAGLGAGRR